MNKRFSNKKIIGGIMAVFLFCLIPQNQVAAESTLWTTQLRESLYNFYNGQWTLDWPSIQVLYKARVVNVDTGAILACGSTVRGGTNIRFEFLPHLYTDIAWFGTGTVFDSPYGNWNNGGNRSGGSVCVAKNAYQARNTFGSGQLINGMFADFSVQPPNKSITGLPASCSIQGNGNAACKETRTSTINAAFNFAATFGKFWSGMTLNGGCYTSRDALTSLATGQNIAIGAKTINCPIHYFAPTGKPPQTPAMRRNACAIGSISSYVISATDPDTKPNENKVRFLLDWNADGTTDQIMPASGYYESGTEQTIPHVWSSTGAKSIRVTTEDNQGLTSAPLLFQDEVTDCIYPSPLRPGATSTVPQITPDDVINADGTLSIDINRLIEDYDEFGLFRPGEIIFEMDPKITNTTCNATWSAKRVDSCSLLKSDIKISDVDITGALDVDPGTYELKCKQFRDNTFITKTQVCRKNPLFREV